MRRLQQLNEARGRPRRTFGLFPSQSRECLTVLGSIQADKHSFVNSSLLAEGAGVLINRGGVLPWTVRKKCQSKTAAVTQTFCLCA